MSNSFPAAPSHLQLSGVSYSAGLPTAVVQPGSALDYGSGVGSQLIYTVPSMGASFTFETPGEFGTFDQTAFEGMLASAVSAVLQVLAGMSGASAAALAGQVVITRTWIWTDTVTGSMVTWLDAMAYPPA